MTAAAIAAVLAERQQLFIPEELATQLAVYLDLLLRWNARTNLSAIREPEAIVLRHFGESLQCAALLPADLRSLLDFGSGAGFPGMVCSLSCRALQVTLAESRRKKAAFLQELVRTLPGQVSVHAGRVEAMEEGLLFDGVVMRAVDRMQDAVAVAQSRVKVGGWLILMTTPQRLAELAPSTSGLAWVPTVALKGTDQGVVARARRLSR